MNWSLSIGQNVLRFARISLENCGAKIKFTVETLGPFEVRESYCTGYEPKVNFLSELINNMFINQDQTITKDVSVCV